MIIKKVQYLENDKYMLIVSHSTSSIQIEQYIMEQLATPASKDLCPIFNLTAKQKYKWLRICLVSKK